MRAFLSLSILLTQTTSHVQSKRGWLRLWKILTITKTSGRGRLWGVAPNVSSLLNSQWKIIITFNTVRVKLSCLLRFTLASNSGANASQFGSGKVSCLLRFTPATNSRAHTSQLWSGEVLCLHRFTLTTNSRAHTSQFGDGGLILYWGRIRKNVTNPERTDRQRKQL